MERNVILLRREPDELTDEEKAAFKAAFPDTDLNFVRTDPENYIMHAKMCRDLNPVAVLLPREKPIPSQAMEEGFQHIVIANDELQELLPVVPQFKPFEPDLQFSKYNDPQFMIGNT